MSSGEKKKKSDWILSVKRAKQGRRAQRPHPRHPPTVTQAADSRIPPSRFPTEVTESGQRQGPRDCLHLAALPSVRPQAEAAQGQKGPRSPGQAGVLRGEGRPHRSGRRPLASGVILSQPTRLAFPHLPRHSEVASSTDLWAAPHTLAPKES